MPSVIGVTERMIAQLGQAVPIVGQHQQRLTEEYLFGFGLSDPVLVGALAAVPRIPMNPSTRARSGIRTYMAAIYDRCNGGGRESPRRPA